MGWGSCFSEEFAITPVKSKKLEQCTEGSRASYGCSLVSTDTIGGFMFRDVNIHSYAPIQQ